MRTLLAAAALLVPWPVLAVDGFVLAPELPNGPLARTLEVVERGHALGATHFAVPIELCQKDKAASEVELCSRVELRHIEALIAELKVRGFTVSVFPFLLPQDGTWRGQIEPADFKAWTKTYAKRLHELESVAAEAGADEFLVGSEMSSLYLAHPDFWESELDHAHRRLPRAKVFLVANWDQATKIPFWRDSDFIGVSAYYRVLGSCDADTSPQSPLEEGWKAPKEALLSLSRSTGRPIYVNELGYCGRSDAAWQPWACSAQAAPDPGLQARLFRAFSHAWSGEPRLERALVWALAEPGAPDKDFGYGVLDKPAGREVAEFFRLRNAARGPEPKPLDVLFTLDDLPIWFVSDVGERLEHYAALRRILERHHVPALAFVNASGIRDPREWDELERWREAGIRFGNHTYTHLPRGKAGEAAFLVDVDSDTRSLDRELVGWDRDGQWFRYPNLDYGPTPAERESTCRELRARGFELAPVSLDTKDWSWGKEYQDASGRTLEDRPKNGAPARRVAAAALAIIDKQTDAAYASARQGALAATPAILLMHSSRFTRDYLDHVLTGLEARGVRWVPPPRELWSPYRPADGCLPRCLASRACF